MATGCSKEVAIIGGGPAGLTLALCLHTNNIPCTVYEMKVPEHDAGFSLMGQPNSLRIFDDLGVYRDIPAEAARFDDIKVRNTAHEIVSINKVGDEDLYGYRTVRLFRNELSKMLRSAALKRGIPILHNKCFDRVVTEHGAGGGVEFQFKDGSRHEAALLVGADGIYSSVRRYIDPDVKPVFSGALIVMSQLDGRSLRVPETKGEDYFPCVMQGAHPGFVMFPERSDWSSLLIFAQKFGFVAKISHLRFRPSPVRPRAIMPRSHLGYLPNNSTSFIPETPARPYILTNMAHRYPDLGRAGFEALQKDKKKLRELMFEHAAYWPDPLKSAFELLKDEDLSHWPFETLPTMESWYSKEQKVLVLGDAAHALSPSSGQGMSQAVEDSYTLGILLGHVWKDGAVKMSDALDFWQRERKARVLIVQKLAQAILQQRLPEAQRKKISGLDGMESPQARRNWLFSADIRKDVEDWIKEYEGK